MKNNKELIKHIKTYSVFEWMVLIRRLENLPDEEFMRIEPNDLERFALRNSNWYTIILDLAIRFSDDKKTKVDLNNLPVKNDYRKFISLYINSKGNESNFQGDLDSSFHIAISRYGHEQLKRYAPMVNEFGRLIDLYEEKELLFKQFLGLTPKQIFTFCSIANMNHNNNLPFDFKSIYAELKIYDSKIKAKKLEQFFSVFSISIKNYRLRCKELGFTKEIVKNERIIERCPIIGLGNENYFIPSINALSEALTHNILDTLCQTQVNQNEFKRSFGDTFENYTRRLTKHSHEEYFYECHDLIIENKKEKAEYYLLKDDSVIVIESKLLPVDENVILNAHVRELENEFIGTMDKALSQISSCFNKIDVENKLGIIVIHTHALMLENYIELIRKRLDYDFIDSILILSIVDFEILIHNPYEKIIGYFTQESRDKKQLLSYFNQQNPYLQNVFKKANDSMIDELEKTNIISTKGNE
jgi:hypothetical protein